MFDSLVNYSAMKWNVPPDWIQAVILTESSGNPNAYRAEPAINDASYGLMQLLYSTAQSLGYTGSPDGLYDPGVNIDLGTKLLSQLREKYGDDVQAVYSAYNSGSPTKYLSSNQVASNVVRFMKNLEGVIAANPMVATSGIGALLVLVLLYFWKKGKGK
jgi:soluble lytic murein transglycosylase-like protein